MLEKLITKAVSSFVSWVKANAWHSEHTTDDACGPEQATYTGHAYYVGNYRIVVTELDQDAKQSKQSEYYEARRLIQARQVIRNQA